jgi:hypothetical protein
MHSQGQFRKALAAVLVILAALAMPKSVRAATECLGTGHVTSTQTVNSFLLENCNLGLTLTITGEKFSGLVFDDRLHKTELPIATPFAILLTDGTIYNATNLELDGQPTNHVLLPRPDASRLAERLRGVQLDIPLETVDHSLHFTWSLILLDAFNSSICRCQARMSAELSTAHLSLPAISSWALSIRFHKVQLPQAEPPHGLTAICRFAQARQLPIRR